jgi:hypothetical protein
VDETNESVENAERVWTPQNTLLIEELALTEEKVKIEGNTTTGILTTLTGILLYDDLRQGQQLSKVLLFIFQNH